VPKSLESMTLADHAEAWWQEQGRKQWRNGACSTKTIDSTEQPNGEIIEHVCQKNGLEVLVEPPAGFVDSLGNEY